MPTHVALNLVFLVPGETGGMETYARELIPRLAADERLEVTCLVNQEAWAEKDAPWEGLARLIPVKARNRLEWVRGEQWHVPRVAREAGSDVIHSLASTAPLTGPQVRVTTVHDLNYMMVPEAHFGVRGLGMRALVPLAARRSDRVIVDAESTRRDLELRVGLSPEVIDVVPLAAGSPSAAPTEEADLRAQLGLGSRPVVFSPGAKRPHKNAAVLIRALAELPPDGRPVLVISGYQTPYEDELHRMALELDVAKDLVVAGYLDPEDLEGLYALSSLVTVPSRYEGFGLPVLEAMIRGVPVVASTTSSLPEVAGAAALLVDPDSAQGFAAAIAGILGDPARAAALAGAGVERAREFSWERTAELTARSYLRAVGVVP